uniref:Uncharacterized protein n=1 Tax=Arundo donax TaxID=35708 RepID=A0A0A9AIA3_ARUDO
MQRLWKDIIWSRLDSIIVIPYTLKSKGFICRTLSCSDTLYHIIAIPYTLNSEK